MPLSWARTPADRGGCRVAASQRFGDPDLVVQCSREILRAARADGERLVGLAYARSRCKMWPFWARVFRSIGESLGWVAIRLHPHDKAVAEGEPVRHGHIPECAVGQVAVDMVDDHDVVAPPGGGRFSPSQAGTGSRLRCTGQSAPHLAYTRQCWITTHSREPHCSHRTLPFVFSEIAFLGACQEDAGGDPFGCNRS